MFDVKLFFFAGVIGVGCVNCILTKGNLNGVLEKSDIKKTDSAAEQSIDRDYIAGFEDNYGHGGYGLSAHAHYGFPEGNEGYGVIEASKHHIHHTEDHHHHHYDHQKHHNYDHHKVLAIKSLLVPLAGVALLGAAAAFVSNPILLQLGVISGTSLGRKKRDLDIKSSFKSTLSPEDQIRLNEIKLLEKFMAQIPKQTIATQGKKMLADYFSSTGATMKNLCLERLACELHSTEGISMPVEAKVLTIVVNEILDNNFIQDDMKISLLKAIEKGKANVACGIFECKELENQKYEMKTWIFPASPLVPVPSPNLQEHPSAPNTPPHQKLPSKAHNLGSIPDGELVRSKNSIYSHRPSNTTILQPKELKLACPKMAHPQQKKNCM